MSKAAIETALRNIYLDLIRETISKQMEIDALDVSASEMAIPCLDSEGNEAWVLVKVSIPRGTRNGNGYDPYDGYAAAEDYQLTLRDRAAKKAAAEQKKQAKIARDEQKRAEKAKAKAEAEQEG